MENIEIEYWSGDNDPRRLTYPIETMAGRIETLGQAATRLTSDLCQRSETWERAHEAIGAALHTGNDIDIRMATHLIELVCREASALRLVYT